MMKKRRRIRFKINNDTMTTIVVLSLSFCVCVVIVGIILACFCVDISSIVSSALLLFGTELGICGLMKLYDKGVEQAERRAEERRKRKMSVKQAEWECKEELRENEMNEAAKITVQNLLTVKSIVTIMLTVVFSYLAVVGRISGEQFLTIFSVVVAFYFGTQYQKGKEGAEEGE